MSASPLLLSLFKYKAWTNEEVFVELEKLDSVAHAAERHTTIRLINHIQVIDRIFDGHPRDAHARGTARRGAAQRSVAPPRDTFTVHLHRSEPERREPG